MPLARCSARVDGGRPPGAAMAAEATVLELSGVGPTPQVVAAERCADIPHARRQVNGTGAATGGQRPAGVPSFSHHPLHRLPRLGRVDIVKQGLHPSNGAGHYSPILTAALLSPGPLSRQLDMAFGRDHRRIRGGMRSAPLPPPLGGLLLLFHDYPLPRALLFFKGSSTWAFVEYRLSKARTFFFFFS